MFKNLTIIAIGLAMVVAVLLGPLAVIWAVNELFATSIAYTFWTWLAVIIIGAFISPNVKIAKKS